MPLNTREENATIISPPQVSATSGFRIIAYLQHDDESPRTTTIVYQTYPQVLPRMTLRALSFATALKAHRAPVGNPEKSSEQAQSSDSIGGNPRSAGEPRRPEGAAGCPTAGGSPTQTNASQLRSRARHQRSVPRHTHSAWKRPPYRYRIGCTQGSRGQGRGRGGSSRGSGDGMDGATSTIELRTS